MEWRACIENVAMLPQLKLYGHSIDEAESSQDPAFLVEIMDINERLEEADSEEVCIGPHPCLSVD